MSKSTSGCSPRYHCCLREVNSTGCKKVCKKCGKDWGSDAGKCFKKEHTLVGIMEKTEEEIEAMNASLRKPEPEINILRDTSKEEDPFLPGRKDGSRKSNHKFGLPPVITYHMF